MEAPSSKGMLALIADALRDAPSETLVQFGRVDKARRVQNRVEHSATAAKLIERAREHRGAMGVPFWHALFLLGADDDEGVPMSILEGALAAQPMVRPRELLVPNDPAQWSTVESAIAGVEARELVALTSAVRCPDGAVRHLPMFDLGVKHARLGAEPTAARALEALNVKGWLIDSGRSFHFLGRTLLDETDWRDLMYRALLLAPIIDDRWVAYQLRAGFAALRVSTGENGDEPRPLRTIGL